MDDESDKAEVNGASDAPDATAESDSAGTAGSGGQSGRNRTLPPHTLSLPNILTYLRIVAVPTLVLFFYLESNASRWMSLAVFVIASFSDFLDGYLARAWEQQSAIGRMLDPIADKLLVATALLLLVSEGTIGDWSVLAAIVIMTREISVSGLREFLAGAQVSVPVTNLSKWKTAMQMVAIGALLVGPAGDRILKYYFWDLGLVTYVGLLLLWIAALLTLITGYDYFRAGLRHIVGESE